MAGACLACSQNCPIEKRLQGYEVRSESKPEPESGWPLCTTLRILNCILAPRERALGSYILGMTSELCFKSVIVATVWRIGRRGKVEPETHGGGLLQYFR